MNALLIDDEQNSHDLMTSLLQKNHQEIKILEKAYSVKEGIKMIKKLKPDLIFLDIEMPDGTGFDLLTHFKEPDFLVIFVTGFDKYVERALNIGAIDFIHKPVDEINLKIALTHAKRWETEQQAKQFEIIKEAYKMIMKDELPPKTAVVDHEGISFVDTVEVISLESMQNLTEFHVSYPISKRIISSRNLKSYEKALCESERFMRVHKSHIINLNKITKLKKGENAHLVMADEKIIPIGRVFKNKLWDHLKNKGLLD
ncbi:MAG: LytTR family DNA-binding domain-containing protein [Bacteroidota bacterium]